VSYIIVARTIVHLFHSVTLGLLRAAFCQPAQVIDWQADGNQITVMASVLRSLAVDRTGEYPHQEAGRSWRRS